MGMKSSCCCGQSRKKSFERKREEECQQSVITKLISISAMLMKQESV